MSIESKYAKPFPAWAGDSPRKQIKDFKKVLKDFEPMVKDPKWLHTGRKIPNFSLSRREAWANWLLCVVLQRVYGADFTFVETDEHEGDGILLNKDSGEWQMTEHVCALDTPGGNPLPKGEQRILDRIDHKIKKGAEYAKDKILIVFFDGAGAVYRNKVREYIRGKHHFDEVFLIGLMTSSDHGYDYSVTHLHQIDSETYKVRINDDFTDWSIFELKDTHRVEVATGRILNSWIQETPL